MREFLTLAEAAYRFNLTARALRQPEWLKLLDARRVRGRWYVPAEAIDALFRAGDRPSEDSST